MKYGELNLGQIEALVNKLGGMDGVASLLADEMVVTKKEINVQPPKPEVEIDPIVRVDRSIKLIFPNWVKKVMHPEIQDIGPSEFDIAKVEQWLHDDQKKSWVNGKVIYEFHEANNMLKEDFGLRELLAIQAKGIEFFRKYFKGKAVVGWKSVVLHDGDYLNVPYLVGHGDKVKLGWYWIDYRFYSNDPALRLVSSPQNSKTKVSSES